MLRQRSRIQPAASALLLFGLAIAVAPPAPATPRPPADALQSFLVIHLQQLSAAEAMTLLRVEVGVAAVSALTDPDLLVIRDLPEQVERSERLLRSRDAVAATAEPHPPLVLLRSPDALPAERLYEMNAPEKAKRGVTVLRALYGTKSTEIVDLPPGLRIRDTPEILDSIGALFRALGWLSESPEETVSP
jgi:hypothetical protein